jgi:hypothetical protein
MTDAYPWFGIVEGGQLEQGDVLADCPTYRPSGNGRVEEETRDVVILSHSCDLAHGKLEMVQVCPLWTLDDLAARAEYFRSRTAREELRRGNLPGYNLLNRCALAGFEREFRVCDYRALCGVSLETIKLLAARQSPRIRLLPPYREHLAQAFARFFMRVGLPVDVPPFR